MNKHLFNADIELDVFLGGNSSKECLILFVQTLNAANYSGLRSNPGLDFLSRELNKDTFTANLDSGQPIDPRVVC